MREGSFERSRDEGLQAICLQEERLCIFFTILLFSLSLPSSFSRSTSIMPHDFYTLSLSYKISWYSTNLPSQNRNDSIAPLFSFSLPLPPSSLHPFIFPNGPLVSAQLRKSEDPGKDK